MVDSWEQTYVCSARVQFIFTVPVTRILCMVMQQMRPNCQYNKSRTTRISGKQV